MNQAQHEKMLLTMQEIIATIEIKDKAYGESWKSHGGFSAFFNLDRKYSRIQNMAQDQEWDIFAAMLSNPESGPDALKDLIAYALLILAETYDPIGWSSMIVEETMPPQKLDWKEQLRRDAEAESGEPGKEYVDQDREE